MVSAHLACRMLIYKGMYLTTISWIISFCGKCPWIYCYTFILLQTCNILQGYYILYYRVGICCYQVTSCCYRITMCYVTGLLYFVLQGYYMNRDVFGSKGDFITSPEISQMFGEVSTKLIIFYHNPWTYSQLTAMAAYPSLESANGRSSQRM